MNLKYLQKRQKLEEIFVHFIGKKLKIANFFRHVENVSSFRSFRQMKTKLIKNSSICT